MQYADEEEHVTACVQHIQEQKACALFKAREKQKRNAIKQKSFVDYDGKKLHESG